MRVRWLWPNMTTCVRSFARARGSWWTTWKRTPPNSKPLRRGEPEAAELLVVVAIDSVYRGDSSERFEDVRAADVTGMDDRVDVDKGGWEPRVNVSVRVGDHADKHGQG